MEEFSISTQGLAELKKMIIKRLLVTSGMLLAIVVLVYVATGPSSDLTVILPYFLVMGAIFSYSGYNSVKKQMKLLESYKLIITDNTITREQHNTPTIVILKEDVTKIVKGKNGSIGVIGNSKINAIGIPAQVEGIAALELRLQEIKPIEQTKTKDLGIWLLPIIIVGGIILFYLTFKVENKIISGLAGLGTVSYLIYSFFVIQKSKNIERRIKLISYVVWLPILSLLAVVIKKLMM